MNWRHANETQAALAEAEQHFVDVCDTDGEVDEDEVEGWPEETIEESDVVYKESRTEDAELYAFACTMCEWRKTLHVDDLQACYEMPFAPCGDGWECIECVG